MGLAALVGVDTLVLAHPVVQTAVLVVVGGHAGQHIVQGRQFIGKLTATNCTFLGCRAIDGVTVNVAFDGADDVFHYNIFFGEGRQAACCKDERDTGFFHVVLVFSHPGEVGITSDWQNRHFI